jgi:hypothetical protein
MSEQQHAPNLEMINAFLESQEGRCKVCHQLFEHCGGDERNSLALVCEPILMEMQGVFCSSCAFDLKNQQKIAQ